MDLDDMIYKKAAAEIVINHININIKMGVFAIIIPFVSIAAFIQFGQYPALLVYVIGLIYIVFILIKSRKYKDYLINEYDLQIVNKKRGMKKDG